MKNNIGIINVGIGNVQSIKNMLYACESDSDIINKPEELSNYRKIILPGVGSYDSFIERLHYYDLVVKLKQMILSKKVIILGICLGMQVLFKMSEEGKYTGLSILDGEIKKLKNSIKNVKIPHNGWNDLDIKLNSKLLKINDNLKFYFNHSFFLEETDKSNIVSITNYGQNIISAIEKENILGVQFHPEKSHSYGKLLFKRFIAL